MDTTHSGIAPDLPAPDLRRRRRRRTWTMGIVLALVASAAGVVHLRNTLAAPPAGPATRLSAASITEMDSLVPSPSDVLPRSVQPAGGMLFVRCTHLWSALPDGTHAHLLLSRAGLASPAYSPDARTIAFIATSENGTAQIWVAAADGSGSREVGELRSKGVPVTAEAQSLTWSPDGSYLAFSLVTPPDNLWTNGSAVWRLTLATGGLVRLTTGASEPSWNGKSLLASKRSSAASDANFAAIATTAHDAVTVASRLSSTGDDLAFAVPPAHWYGVGTETTATILRGIDARPELALQKNAWSEKPFLETQPGSGERIDPASRPAVSNDGTIIGVDLIGSDGGPDLGLYNTITRKWTYMNYAWNSVWSPAPPAFSSLSLWRASAVVRAFLGSWSRGSSDAQILEGSSFQRSLLAFGGMGYALGTPVARGARWSVPATVFGRRSSSFGYRRLTLSVQGRDGRLVVTPSASSPMHRIRTVTQAVRFLRATLTVRVLAPAGLPAATSLASRPIDASSWNTRATGELRLKVPWGGNGRNLITFGFGNGGFGCGTSSKAVAIGGSPGDTVTRSSIASGSIGEVIWPAKPGFSTAPFSVAGNLPRRILLNVARATQVARGAR